MRSVVGAQKPVVLGHTSGRCARSRADPAQGMAAQDCIDRETRSEPAVAPFAHQFEHFVSRVENSWFGKIAKIRTVVCLSSFPSGMRTLLGSQMTPPLLNVVPPSDGSFSMMSTEHAGSVQSAAFAAMSPAHPDPTTTMSKHGGRSPRSVGPFIFYSPGLGYIQVCDIIYMTPPPLCIVICTASATVTTRLIPPYIIGFLTKQRKEKQTDGNMKKDLFTSALSSFYYLIKCLRNFRVSLRNCVIIINLYVLSYF